MKFLYIVMRFLGYLFLYFLMWSFCILILAELNLNSIINSSTAGVISLISTIIIIVLFIQQLMITRTKHKSIKRTRRQPRLNRYVDKEQDHKRTLTIIIISVVMFLVVLTQNEALVAFTIIVCVIFWITRSKTKKNEYIYKNSERLRELEKLNVEYSRVIKDYNEMDHVNHKFPTKKAYDYRNEKLIFYQYLVDFKSYTQDVIKKMKDNRKIKDDYEYQLQRIYKIQPIKKYSDEESSAVRRRILKIKTDYKISFTFSYTSAQGRKHYRNKVTFTYDDIERGLEVAEKELRRRRNFVYVREQERAKMTRSMRYDVFVRDGFKCRICGAGREDGIKLHVDHIFPIAKGGKTIMSNLQTLCEDCNVGKWDKVN